VLAGLAQATQRWLEGPALDKPLADRLALIIEDLGALMIESTSGEVLVPSRLADRVMATWAETDPPVNGTESEFRWAAGVFGVSGR
jgi:hypothetical protein